MKMWQGKKATGILTILLVLAMIVVAKESAQFVSTVEEHAKRASDRKESEITIVVDAGHGKTDGRPKEFGVKEFRI